MTSARDEIRLQVIWSKLIAIVEEQARMLMRTAFSPVVRDSGDLSAALFDRAGNMLAQAQTGTPGHVNSTVAAVPQMLAVHPADTLSEGDHLITNDPWIASGHVHDITVASPVFKGGRVIGFLACTCHQLDIGGRGQGPDGSSVFEEGLAIPVMKLTRKGMVNEDLMAMIRANVRTPDEVEADILSYVAANEASARILVEAVETLGLEDLECVGAEILGRSRAAMIEEIRKLPRTTASNTITLDAFGTPITITCTLTIGEDELLLDFAGTSPSHPRGINLVYNYTNAYASFGARCIIGADVPNNSGSLSTVRVVAPQGSILNVTRPNPVSARHIIGQFLPEAVLGCLAQIVPEKVPAEGSAGLWGIQLRGGPEVARHFPGDWQGPAWETLFFNAGGGGARPTADGLSTTAFPSGVRAMPVEVVENHAPIVLWKKELRPGSAGDGTFRGGYGQSIELATRDGSPVALFAMFDRTTVQAQGRRGGTPGAMGALGLASGPALQPKGYQIVGPGERLRFEVPGGAGFGDPAGRDPQARARDRRSGLEPG
jgi:N-methylhydantoinase B/oxoprolinase/acetone carboxylase alpha subunit